MPFNNNYQVGVIANPLTQSVYVTPSRDGGATPTPPIEQGYWISNVGNSMISNTGTFIIFGGVVPPVGTENWVTNLNEDMVTDTGDYIIFED